MTQATADYGPENPRDWSAGDPSLLDPKAPHETAGVLRAHRSGKPGAELMVLLRLKGTRLMQLMQKALDDETAAEKSKRAIHDAGVAKGAK